MDQVRVVLVWLKEQHFWVLSVLASLIAVGCWYMASGDLAKRYTDNKSEIDGQFSQVNAVKNRPYHPNATVNEREEQEIKALVDKVTQIWNRLYTRQRETALIWPEQLDSNISRKTDSFILHVKDKKFGEFIADNFRNRYLNYIQNHFPELPSIIKALEVDDKHGGGGRGGRGGMEFGFETDFSPMGTDRGETQEEEKDFLVRWEDQFEIKQQLAWSNRPSSLKIWVTQEDLWVYRTLLEAIAATNAAAGADRYSNAAVRDIYQFEVGKKAAKGLRTAQRIHRPQSDSARGFAEGGGMEPGMGGERGMVSDGFSDYMEPGAGGERFDGGEGNSNSDATLLANRYIDGEGQPLPAPEAEPGAPISFPGEYKRLPVRLVLNMDQRWLPRLIVEMANAPMQIEVEEVRINPPGGATGGGRSGGGGRTQLRALQLAGQGGRSGVLDSGAGGRGDTLAFEREPQVAHVIVRGIVYIFNPPDEDLLSVDGSGGAGDF